MRPAGLFLSLAIASPAAADVGMQLRQLNFDHRDTPVAAAMWYPAQPSEIGVTEFGDNPVFHGTPVHMDAAPTEGNFPVILLSHGLGGNFRTLSWLGAGLADAGALVVAMHHPGSTTGDLDPMGSLDHAARAADISALLDWVEASDFDTEDQPVAAVGFSLGGWTALTLGGVRGNLEGYADHCAEAAGSTHCRDLENWGVDLATLDADAWGADLRDPRITHVAALDPGLTYGLGAQDVAGLEAETLLITLGDAESRLVATDISPEGSRFASLAAQADWHVIAPGSHFSALLTCKRIGRLFLRVTFDDPVCDVAPGEDRAETHAAAIALISAHLGL